MVCGSLVVCLSGLGTLMLLALSPMMGVCTLGEESAMQRYLFERFHVFV